MTSQVVVTRIALADTQLLRTAVLRRGTPAKTAVYDGDEHADTVHIGARADGAIVATSTWIRAPWQESPTESAVQLRGMAVDDSLQGTGVGRKLIDAGIDHARSVGARFVWAKARDSALEFYVRCGFRVVGEQFTEPASGMPHHLVVREIAE
ncbi:MAG: GNAT family N-acetyltransferase [Ilumatobacteraceae bacterium]